MDYYPDWLDPIEPTISVSIDSFDSEWDPPALASQSESESNGGVNPLLQLHIDPPVQ